MNAEKITDSVMERIALWLGEGAHVADIRYAILRSHDSVISGLSPRCEAGCQVKRSIASVDLVCELPEGHVGDHSFVEFRGSSKCLLSVEDLANVGVDFPCGVKCPAHDRIADLESQLRTRTKQVRAALAIREAYNNFMREAKW